MVRRTEQNQAFDEEIGKRPEQLPYNTSWAHSGNVTHTSNLDP
jgi:hypothetical protein